MDGNKKRIKKKPLLTRKYIYHLHFLTICKLKYHNEQLQLRGAAGSERKEMYEMRVERMR